MSEYKHAYAIEYLEKKRKERVQYLEDYVVSGGIYEGLIKKEIAQLESAIKRLKEE